MTENTSSVRTRLHQETHPHPEAEFRENTHTQDELWEKNTRRSGRSVVLLLHAVVDILYVEVILIN